MAIAYPNVPGVRFELIAGFPNYCLGDDQSIWSRARSNGKRKLSVASNGWQKMSPVLYSNGYRMVQLFNNGKYRSIGIHRLMLETFVGPAPEGYFACHNDGNPANNSLPNLRWDTQKGNLADKEKHGTSQRGSRSGTAKLTEQDVISIRSLRKDGWTCARIAESYSVSRSLIKQIVRRTIWTHI